MLGIWPITFKVKVTFHTDDLTSYQMLFVLPNAASNEQNNYLYKQQE